MRLHIVTCIYNPIGWKTRIAHARTVIPTWLEQGALVTLVECASGNNPFELTDVPGVRHIGVRSNSLAWNKENLLNIGIANVQERWVGTLDADITFRDPHWVPKALHALQIYPVLQPWSDCYDLGPKHQHMHHHTSFCRQHLHGAPVTPKGKNWWKSAGGPYDYPHSGYAWCWRREVLDTVGGLIDIGGMGSGDHHMALSLAGKADFSMPPGTAETYRAQVFGWQDRAQVAVNRRLGFLWGTIEHYFHGRKADRKYVPRWDMFVKHQFCPHADLKRNTWGVLEFAGNKPELEREWDVYLRGRLEDANVMD